MDNPPRAACAEILSAAQFAAEKHSHQRRKGGIVEPYVNHLIEVARLLAELPVQFDRTLVVAGLLHDTIEDAAVTPAELSALFGEEVAELVGEVSDDKSLGRDVRKMLQIENAPRKSPRAQNLSTADKISNLRSTLHNPPAEWSPERRLEYACWAKTVVDRFPSVDPNLKAEFDRVYARFNLPVPLYWQAAQG